MILLPSHRALLNTYRGTLVIFILFVFSSLCFARDDWQLVNTYDFKHKVSDRLDLTLQLEQKLNRDLGNYYYYHFQPGFVYQLNEFLDFGLSYCYIEEEEERDGGDLWEDENRLVIDPVLKWKAVGFSLDNRLRFEYRYFDLDKDKWRYRNRLRIKRKISLGGFEFSPFLSEEIFYDFNYDEFNQNRFDLGMEKKINEDIALNLYYRIQSQRRGRDWGETNIIGLNFKINL